MNTDFLYLTLAEANSDGCLLREKKIQWTQMGQKNCKDEFEADALKHCFLRTCCSDFFSNKNRISENPDYSKKNFAVLK